MTDLKNIVVTAKDIAEMLGITEKYVSELVLDQGMPKMEFGKFNLFNCFKWYIDYKIKSHQRAIEKLRNEDDNKRLTRANAELKELQLDFKRKNLIPFEEVKKIWLEEMKILAVNLDGLPLKASLEVTGLNDRVQVQNIIKRHLDDARNTIGNLPVNEPAEDI